MCALLMAADNCLTISHSISAPSAEQKNKTTTSNSSWGNQSFPLLWEQYSGDRYAFNFVNKLIYCCSFLNAAFSARNYVERLSRAGFRVSDINIVNTENTEPSDCHKWINCGAQIFILLT